MQTRDEEIIEITNVLKNIGYGIEKIKFVVHGSNVDNTTEVFLKISRKNKKEHQQK